MALQFANAGTAVLLCSHVDVGMEWTIICDAETTLDYKGPEKKKRTETNFDQYMTPQFTWIGEDSTYSTATRDRSIGILDQLIDRPRATRQPQPPAMSVLLGPQQKQQQQQQQLRRGAETGGMEQKPSGGTRRQLGKAPRIIWPMEALSWRAKQAARSASRCGLAAPGRSLPGWCPAGACLPPI
uniref:Uncharacterized protein n=1 Tax=Oryza brachyantha TaxID=4533 RepID=J3MM10_ORYBR